MKTPENQKKTADQIRPAVEQMENKNKTTKRMQEPKKSRERYKTKAQKNK